VLAEDAIHVERGDVGFGRVKALTRVLAFLRHSDERFIFLGILRSVRARFEGNQTSGGIP